MSDKASLPNSPESFLDTLCTLCDSAGIKTKIRTCAALDRPPGSCSHDIPTGQQLLPSQTKKYQYFGAFWFLLMKAVFCNVPVCCCRPTKVRGRHIFIARDRNGFESFQTLLRARPASDPRPDLQEYSKVITFYRGIFLLGFLPLLFYGFLLLVEGLHLPTESSNSNLNANPHPFEDEVTSPLHISLSTQSRLKFASTNVLMYVMVIACLTDLYKRGNKVSKSISSEELRRGGLSYVLPLLLDQYAPLAMVSYCWNPEYSAEIARSLATALPNCWVDIQMLSSGNNVPQTTASVAATSHLMVIFLSRQYLESQNCCIELVNAVKCRQWDQVTVVYLPPGIDHALPKAIIDHFNNFGIKVFDKPRVLLEYLSEHVYYCEGKQDKSRILSWFRRYSSPKKHFAFDIRLPFNRPTKKTGCFEKSRWRRICDPIYPRSASYVGNYFITADGTETGESLGWDSSVVVQAIILLCAVVLTYLNVEAARTINGSEGRAVNPITVFLFFVIIAVIFFLLIPILTNKDAQLSHSAYLAPLSIAAFLNQTWLEKERGRGFSISKPLRAAFESVRRFSTSFQERSGSTHMAPWEELDTTSVNPLTMLASIRRLPDAKSDSEQKQSGEADGGDAEAHTVVSIGDELEYSSAVGVGKTHLLSARNLPGAFLALEDANDPAYLSSTSTSMSETSPRVQPNPMSRSWGSDQATYASRHQQTGTSTLYHPKRAHTISANESMEPPHSMAHQQDNHFSHDTPLPHSDGQGVFFTPTHSFPLLGSPMPQYTPEHFPAIIPNPVHPNNSSSLNIQGTGFNSPTDLGQCDSSKQPYKGIVQDPERFQYKILFLVSELEKAQSQNWTSTNPLAKHNLSNTGKSNSNLYSVASRDDQDESSSPEDFGRPNSSIVSRTTKGPFSHVSNVCRRYIITIATQSCILMRILPSITFSAVFHSSTYSSYSILFCRTKLNKRHKSI